VTHVIRGDDHLSNSFRQLALIRALGWPEPVYAHVPMIHGPDGAKLSKRHGALGVEAYRDDLGILPEALENYLLRLGWAHGDTELVTRAEAIPLFDLSGIGRSPARFDLKKLESVNAHYLKQADDARLADLAGARMAESLGRDLSPSEHEMLRHSMDELKPRAKTLNELAAAADWIVRTRPLTMDEAAAKLLDPAGHALLGLFRERLAGVDAWDREVLEAAAKSVATDAGTGLGKVAGPIRAALAGRTTSPSVFAMMAALGREETMGRIADALVGAGKGSSE